MKFLYPIFKQYVAFAWTLKCLLLEDLHSLQKPIIRIIAETLLKYPVRRLVHSRCKYIQSTTYFTQYMFYDDVNKGINFLEQSTNHTDRLRKPCWAA